MSGTKFHVRTRRDRVWSMHLEVNCRSELRWPPAEHGPIAPRAPSVRGAAGSGPYERMRSLSAAAAPKAGRTIWGQAR